MRPMAAPWAWQQVSPLNDLARFNALKAADPALQTALQQVDITAQTLREIDTQAQMLINAIAQRPQIKAVKPEIAGRAKRHRRTRISPKPTGLALAA